MAVILYFNQQLWSVLLESVAIHPQEPAGTTLTVPFQRGGRSCCEWKDLALLKGRYLLS